MNSPKKSFEMRRIMITIMIFTFLWWKPYVRCVPCCFGGSMRGTGSRPQCSVPKCSLPPRLALFLTNVTNEAPLSWNSPISSCARMGPFPPRVLQDMNIKQKMELYHLVQQCTFMEDIWSIQQNYILENLRMWWLNEKKYFLVTSPLKLGSPIHWAPIMWKVILAPNMLGPEENSKQFVICNDFLDLPFVILMTK